MPKWTYVTDVFASPRDANTVFVTLNNWQRGDYKPYVVKSTDRGKTWTNITGDLPDRHDVWTIVQDHVNGNLLFAGTEFGLFVSVDGGSHWTQMKGGLPVIQVRDIVVQKRETDLVLATFGRGFYILDDYSALRELTPQALADEARLFPLRDAYLFNTIGSAPPGRPRSARCRATGPTPNPPFGAVFTYNVKDTLPADAKLVVTITDDSGKQIRRMEIDKTAGLKRVAWNLRAEPRRAAGQARQARGAGGGQASAASAARQPGRARDPGPLPRDPRQAGGGNGDAYRAAADFPGGAAAVGRDRCTTADVQTCTMKAFEGLHD